MSQRAISHAYIIDAITDSPLGPQIDAALRDVFDTEAAGEVHALSYMLIIHRGVAAADADADVPQSTSLIARAYIRRTPDVNGGMRCVREKIYSLGGPKIPGEVYEEAKSNRRPARAQIPLQTPQPNVEELVIATDFMWGLLSIPILARRIR